jgi:membrane protease YdiL (CAAX protease family)
MYNVFERSKVRYIFGWAVLAFIISIFIPDFKYSTAIILTIILYLIPIWWFMSKLKKEGQSLRQFFSKPLPIKRRTLMASAIMPVIFAAGMLLFVIALILYLFPEAGDMVLPNQEIDLSLGLLIYNVINLVIIAPICEEIIFRGFLLGRLTHKFGLNKGIILSSFIFGAMHFTNVFGATMFGIVLCVLYIKSSSLITTIIVHASYNSVVAGAQILSFMDSSNTESLSAPPMFSTMIGACICTIVALVWIVPFLKKNWKQPLTYGDQTIENQINV